MGGEGTQTRAQAQAHPPALTHAAGEHTGSSLVEVEGADTAHAIGDEGQHVAVEGRTLSWRQSSRSRGGG